MVHSAARPKVSAKFRRAASEAVYRLVRLELYWTPVPIRATSTAEPTGAQIYLIHVVAKAAIAFCVDAGLAAELRQRPPKSNAACNLAEVVRTGVKQVRRYPDGIAARRRPECISKPDALNSHTEFDISHPGD